MARQTMLLKRRLTFIVLITLGVGCINAQPKIYVVSQNWYVSIVDVEQLEIVDDFEIVDPRSPPFEPRVFATSPLLVPNLDLLFVSNEARTYPLSYTGGALKIMKVDLKNKVSEPYFLDPQVPLNSPNLVEEPGTLYFDSENNLLYACYDLEPPTTYVIDFNGNIRNVIKPSEGCPVQGRPRFGNKLYSLGKNRVSELDLTNMKRKVVLTQLAHVGGTPFTGGDLWFISQDETSADLLIADRKTKRYQIRKPLPGEPDLWTIVSEEDYLFDVNGQTTDDIAGYKKFVGQLLTIRPPSPLSDPTPEVYKFWVFDATRNPMPVVYEVTLPSAEQVWEGDPDAPRDPFGPTPYLVPGTNVVAALYTGLGDWRPVKLLLVDAATGKKLKEFRLHAGIAGVAFSN